MKRSRIAASAGTALGTIALIVAFQNCSQTQFSEDLSMLSSINQSEGSGGQTDYSYGNGSGNVQSQTSSSSGVPRTASGKVVPHIKLSDTPEGLAKDSFSPDQVIYGTVYGLGPELFVCMGSRCLFHPGYFISGSTYSDPNVLASKLSNWSYQASDNTWRFTLNYSLQGDVIEKIVVHHKVPKTGDFAELDALGGVDPFQRLDAFVHIKTPANSPQMRYTLSGRIDPYHFGDQKTFENAKAASNFMNVGHLKFTGVSDQLSLCTEKTGSGLCNSTANWKSVKSMAYAKTFPTRKITTVAIYEPLIDVKKLGPLTGNYTIHAVDNASGLRISDTFTTRVQSNVCAFRSNTAVVGPCSDPESGRTCSEAQVGSKIQGTGSCRVTYECGCRFE